MPVMNTCVLTGPLKSAEKGGGVKLDPSFVYVLPTTCHIIAIRTCGSLDSYIKHSIIDLYCVHLFFTRYKPRILEKGLRLDSVYNGEDVQQLAGDYFQVMKEVLQAVGSQEEHLSDISIGRMQISLSHRNSRLRLILNILPSLSFVDRYGLKVKESFVSLLFQLLRVRRDDLGQDQAILLEALRICCREEEGMQSVHQAIPYVMELAGVDKRITGSTAIQLEALKLLVNVLGKSIESRDTFVRNEGIENSLHKLKTIAPDAIPMPPEVFPINRILFHCSVNMNNKEVFQRAKALNTYITLMEKDINCGHPDQVVSNDILKIIFNLTMHLGPLASVGGAEEPSTDEKMEMERMIPLLKRVLTRGDLSDAPYQSPFLLCVLNIPRSIQGRYTDETVVEALLRLLESQIEKNNTPEGLVSLLMILTGISSSNEGHQQFIKDYVYPNSDDQETTMEGPKGGTLIAVALRKHLTSLNVALKHNVQEFLFSVCDSSGDEFGRLNGLGPGAGLLAERNLLSVFSSLKPNPVQPVEREIDSGDEEDVAELERKMERLEVGDEFKHSLTEEQKLGVFKMVREDKK
ncbi:hypothetical protein PROFUN_13548 [Planoprotostelium fungivorum]|uniref:Uncharacterized protein n=1 Tax=Planoprotostelium fungivorum TaxID=1890364 RepID=A0A2P6N3R9_9EUKA|nr:hypothetical protein PROFUN_13548 [Planoprotostelium fungivorum]